MTIDEWRYRLAHRWTPCTCPHRHRGACSSPVDVQPIDEQGTLW